MVYFTFISLLKTLYINSLINKKISLFFLLFFSFSLNLFSIFPAFCQSQEVTLADSLFASSSTSLDSDSLTKKVRSDFSIGIRGGITRGWFEIANPEQNDKNTAGVGSVLTIFTNYRLNSHFSLQPELAIGRYRSNNTLYKVAFLEGTVDYSISTFDLNLMGLYSYSVTDWFSVSAEAGMSVAYSYSSFGKVVSPNNIRIGQIYDVDSNNQFEKVNYGAIIGINPSFNFKNVSLQTSIRYRYGLNNINTFDYSLNRYLANPDRTIQTRDILFQIGFLIPIYKKPKEVTDN